MTSLDLDDLWSFNNILGLWDHRVTAHCAHTYDLHLEILKYVYLGQYYAISK
jgi:hypothetical protein